MRTHRAWPILLCVFLAGCGGLSSSSDSDPAPGLLVGAIFDRTGPQSDFTDQYLAACELAVEDENGDSPFRQVTLVVRDSASSVAGAEAAMTDLLGQGVQFVMGPRTSAQCKQVLPLAEAAGAAIMAPRSVASELALPGDSLFRLIAPDHSVVPMVAEAARRRGVRRMVVLHRNDPFGNDALAVLRAEMNRTGGDVVAAIPYEPGGGPSTGHLAAFLAASLVVRTVYGTEAGVCYFSLSEIVPVFAALNSAHSGFRAMPSFAAQSLANIPGIIASDDASAYCQGSGFQAVAFALAAQAASEYPKGRALLDRIAERSGVATPDELSVNLYDGMRALVRSAKIRGGTAKQNLGATLAETPEGTLGPMTFDANGDRIGAYYGVYEVAASGPTRTWQRTATLGNGAK